MKNKAYSTAENPALCTGTSSVPPGHAMIAPQYMAIMAPTALYSALEEDKMRVIERSLQEIGQSLLVTLPKDWADRLGLKKGHKIRIMIGEEGTLSIAPEHTAQEERKRVVMQYDQHFTRRFFREYFAGNERITIMYTKPPTETERKRIGKFLDKFMNVQVVEETSKKLVVTCFKIDELTVKECLSRMYFLSLNMIDEVLEHNDRTRLGELEQTLTRFYYLLVMQIRRYLREGKYTQKDELPIIRALDYRMVAEKIERIGDLVQILPSSKKVDEDLSLVREFYAKAVLAFINDDYEKSIPMLVQEQKLETKLGNNRKVLHILQYAKEISMLVR